MALSKRTLHAKNKRPFALLLQKEENENIVTTATHSLQGTAKKLKLDKQAGRETDDDAARANKLMDLEDLRMRLCPKDVKIEVERLLFKEIFVTTPSKGLREVCYFCEASDTEDDDLRGENESNSSDNEVLYEDWRIQTIRAFPPNSKSKTRETNVEASSGSFYMEIPACYDFIFSVDYAKGDLHNILDILNGHGMSTSIIDGYFMLRIKKYYKDFQINYNRQLEKLAALSKAKAYAFRKSEIKKEPEPFKATPTNFQYLSVNFMWVKDREDPISSFEADMNFLPDMTMLRGDSDVQLIAPLYASKHLYLSVFDFREKTVHAFDSSWHYLPMELREGQIKVILRAIAKDCRRVKDEDKGDDDYDPSSEWKINFVSTSCPQYDEYSCGIFTIYYAENILKGVAHDKNRWQLSKKRVTDIRRHIVKELLSTTTVGRQFLRAISDS